MTHFDKEVTGDGDGKYLRKDLSRSLNSKQNGLKPTGVNTDFTTFCFTLMDISHWKFAK